MSSPVVVVSRSAPPDVGGYQRQLSLVLPRLDRRWVGVSAIRSAPPTGAPLGWPGNPTRLLPAYRLPRKFRGLADPVIVGLAVLAGLRAASERPTLLLLSPSMVGARPLVLLWDRFLGAAVVRVPGAGDTRRLGDLAALTRTTGVAPGPALVAEMAGHGVPATLVPNAVEPGRPSTRQPIVAVVGRLIGSKRVDLAIDAWAAVADEHPGWSLSIVGSEQSEADGVEGRLRRQAGGVPRVTFHGEQADPWSVAGTASVLLFLSEREGSPNVVIEALARGLTVVAPELAMATWFDPLPPFVAIDANADVATVLDQVLGDDAERDRLAVSGPAFVDRHHGVGAVTDRWTAVLDRSERSQTVAGWSRTPLAVAADGLVLDVGSGRFPNARADVLCERDPVRGWRRAVADRPFVIADAAALPFRDGAFDHVIASHLLEHVDRPNVVVAELARVASSGYIETPHRRYERLLPEEGHRWAVDVRGRTLRFAANPWRVHSARPSRRAAGWLYHAGERKTHPTLRLPGPAGMGLRSLGRLVRGTLNRTGVTTARYTFGPDRPPIVEEA